MKKQIFSLILSAAIFTTNPLFGMEKEKDSESKITIRPFANINMPKSKGLFHLLPKEMTINFISYALVPNDRVLRNITLHRMRNLCCTSKAMYNLVQSPELWKTIAKDQNIELKDLPVLFAKDQVIEHLDRLYFNSLFEDVKKSYVIKISELQGIKKMNTCYNQENDPDIDPEDWYDRYNFLIDKRLFTLMIERRSLVLDTLPPHSYATFRGHTPYFDLGFVATLKKQDFIIVPKTESEGPQAKSIEYKK